MIRKSDFCFVVISSDVSLPGYKVSSELLGFIWIFCFLAPSLYEQPRPLVMACLLDVASGVNGPRFVLSAVFGSSGGSMWRCGL